MPRPVRVVSVGPKPSAPNSRGGMASVARLLRDGHDERVQVRTVATYVDDPRAARLAVGVTGMVASVAMILSGRVDVVHVHLAHKGSVVRKAAPLFAARLRGVPSVVHAHSYNFAAWFDELPPRVQTLVRWALRADRWIVLGDGLAEEYTACLRLPAGRVLVLRNPANLPEYREPRANTPDGPVRGVFLGRHGDRKGSYDLVTALALLDPDVRRAIHVVAAGDGEVDEVRAAATAAGVDDVLEIRGWVGPEERDALLADGDLFVLPSRDEALPMALLEAMGWGLVPIVTAVGGIPEVLADRVDGMFVPPGDAVALAAAVSGLVRDDDLRRELAANAQRTATEFGAEKWFETLVNEWLRLSLRRRVG